MPTRKQRKRALKERRHEYETVWVDGEGNELEEPPDDVAAAPRERRADGSKAQQKRPQQRSGRPQPSEPSWGRSIRRSLLLGAAVLVFMYLLNGKASAGARVVRAGGLAVLYTALFIPFTYYLDRFVYRRWERTQSATKKR